MRPSPSGGRLRTGNPGNKGGGRPPSIFKDFLADLRKDKTALAALKRAALDETSPNFRTAWQLVRDYDEDKPVEKKEVAIKGPVEVRVVVERESRKRTAG